MAEDFSKKLVSRFKWDAHIKVHDLFSECLEFLRVNHKTPFTFYALWLLTNRNLKNHIRFEEKQVLPIYREEVKDYEPPGAPGNFDKDHQRLEQIGNRIGGLSLSCFFRKLDEAVILFELGAWLDLLNHHDVREAHLFYPPLEKILSGLSREKILSAMGKVPLISPKEFTDSLPDWKKNENLKWLEKTYRGFLLVEKTRKAWSGFVENLEVPGSLDPALKGPSGRILELVEKGSGKNFKTEWESLLAQRQIDQGFRTLIGKTVEDAVKPFLPGKYK